MKKIVCVDAGKAGGAKLTILKQYTLLGITKHFGHSQVPHVKVLNDDNQIAFYRHWRFKFVSDLTPLAN